MGGQLRAEPFPRGRWAWPQVRNQQRAAVVYPLQVAQLWPQPPNVAGPRRRRQGKARCRNPKEFPDQTSSKLITILAGILLGIFCFYS
jgi:hypothetical protein